MEPRYANLSEETRKDFEKMEDFLRHEKLRIEGQAFLCLKALYFMPEYVLSYMESMGIHVVSLKPSSSTEYFFFEMKPGDFFEEVMLAKDDKGILYRVHARIGGETDGPQEGNFLTSLFRDEENKPVYQWIKNKWEELEPKYSKRIRSFGNGFGSWVEPEDIIPAYKALLLQVHKTCVKKLEMGATMLGLIVSGLQDKNERDYRITMREDLFREFVESDEGRMHTQYPFFDIDLVNGTKLVGVFAVDKVILKTNKLNASLKIITPENAMRMFGVC